MVGQWSDWKNFPDPRENDFFCAPFGPGVYELRRSDTKAVILRGEGKNCALRMTSLLPPPLGQGTRNNEAKRVYVLQYLRQIEYRCCACNTKAEARKLESKQNRELTCLFTT